MTSPALFVLFLAHVCSIFGRASEHAADHGTLNMQTHKQNRWTNSYKNLDININELNSKLVYQETYTESEGFRHSNLHETMLDKVHYKHTRSDVDVAEIENLNIQTGKQKLKITENSNSQEELKGFEMSEIENFNLHKRKDQALKRVRRFDEKTVVRRVKRDDNDPRCKSFEYDPNRGSITHPHDEKISDLYYNNTDCTTVISVAEGNVIELTFVDKFRIEYHPDCAYDYLEIRDGEQGYSEPMARVCGQTFPRVLKTKGPSAWLKFHSDDTIEYEGFRIDVNIIPDQSSYSIPKECHKVLKPAITGTINSSDIDAKCKEASETHGFDLLWTINTKPFTKIFLNFTYYALDFPNECDQNGIQIFGSVLELSAKLEYYCGSVANPVISKTENGEPGNIMQIRLYTSKQAMEKTAFVATYTAFRSLNLGNSSDTCDTVTEFDCADNTCIDIDLKCSTIAHCRLKTDQDPDLCKQIKDSPLKDKHIVVILVIFSLILSGMTFVFLFKCTRKLYQDHKIIKEHIRQSCEDRLDRLDSLVGSRLTLDAKRLQRDSEPRASLERENQANEMFKRKRDSFSKRKQPTSIDSDFQETHLDMEEEIWRREVDTQLNPEDIQIERNGRTRRRDTLKKEDSIRNKRESEKKEIRDVSVGAPDTKESGCQTRESLFQADPPPSSDGKSSSSNSRGFSTFGYSGATIARRSPPTNTSEITIELLKQVPRQESVKPQKKTERRPMSTETTRSAPDVIIVSKPIR